MWLFLNSMLDFHRLVWNRRWASFRSNNYLFLLFLCFMGLGWWSRLCMAVVGLTGYTPLFPEFVQQFIEFCLRVAEIDHPPLYLHRKRQRWSDKQDSISPNLRLDQTLRLLYPCIYGRFSCKLRFRQPAGNTPFPLLLACTNF